MKKRGRIIVLHFVGQMPLAGIAWQAMHYVLGLERLGYETWYIEDGGANPYDPRANSVVMECDYNVAYVAEMMNAYGLGDRWAYWDAINDVYHGLPRERVHALYRESDALINLCGATRLREEHMACPVRIMVDTDPVYEQIKYAKADPAAREYLQAHTHFFTYGENIGAADCPVPLSGIDWRPTRPPVIPDLWPVDGRQPDCFTTIATWENKGKNIEFEGENYYWSKHVNFMRFLDLPQHSDQCFMMAMLPPERSGGGRSRRQGLAHHRSEADLRRHDALRRFHPRLARRVHRGEGHLCAAEQRLVQRPQRVLPRLGPAGRHHEDRIQQVLPGGRRTLRVLDPAGDPRRPRPDQSRLRQAQSRGPRYRRGIFRQRPRYFSTALGRRVVNGGL